MIAIETLHDFIRGTIKQNYGGFISPADIDRAINRASFDLFDEVVDNYKYGDEFEFDHLFLKRGDLSLAVLDSGVKNLPSDYVEAVGFYYKDSSANLHEGNLLKWKSYIDRRNSQLVPPVINDSTSEYKPIATIYDGKIEFSPRPSSGTYNFVLVYFTEPTEGIYGFTESNGVITFNDGTSTDLDWDKRYFTDIATRALTYLGFPIRDAQTIQTETVIDNNRRVDGNN